MDVDGSSLAAAALYDMKNEQLQLANAALQQAIPSNENKQPETTVSTTNDQSVTTTTTTEGQQFAEGGKRRTYLTSIHRLFFMKKWVQKFHLKSVNFCYTKDIF